MQVFDENIINLDLKSSTKEAVFEEMAEMLLKEGYISNINDFLKALYEREKMGITGLGNHIAIPHGKSDSVNKVGIAIGKAEHDISWETHDNKPVRIVLMFVVKNDNQYEENHMVMLSQIASKLAHDDVIEALLKANTKEEIIQILQ